MISRFRPRSGSALVVTLLVLTVLTIIVVAFLQSMTIERQTARSYLDRYRAELAANSAQTEAVTQLSKLMVDNPYHGVGYLPGPWAAVNQSTPTSGGNPVVPVLYGSPAPTTTAAPSPTPHYLISGTTNNGTTFPGNINPGSLDPKDNQQFVSLNRKNGDTLPDNSGWMGSPSPLDTSTGLPVGPPTADTYRECRVPWVYLLQDPTKPHQPDRNKSNFNPYISRYAWWVEDDTSKIDLLKTGNNKGSGGSFQPPLTENPADTNENKNLAYKDSVSWQPSNLDLGAVPVHNGKVIEVTDSSTNTTLLDFLGRLGSLPKDPRVLNQAPGFNGSEPTARFYTTLNSVSNELSGNGRRRVNINALVHNDSSNPTQPVVSSVIASDIDDIAYAIAGKHIMTQRGNNGLFNSESDESSSDQTVALLPNFGDRFWPTSLSGDNKFRVSSLAAEKQKIYLTKIAANIRDYIDTDFYPTFVDDSGNVISSNNLPNLKNPTAPFPNNTFPNLIDGDFMPRAIGKESLPYLSKVGFSVRYVDTNSTLSVYETMGFYNPSTKTFVAPSGTILQCFNRLSWVAAGGLAPFQMPAYTLDLSGVQFPAGKLTTITTSPGTSTDPKVLSSPRRGGTDLIMNPPGAATHTPSTAVTSYNPSVYTPSSIYDIGTKMVWSGPGGYFGGFPALTVTSFVKETSSSPGYTMKKANPLVTRVNNMEGNNAQRSQVPAPSLFSSHTGDPRSIEEPLTFNGISGAKGTGSFQDQTRFYDDTSLDMITQHSDFISPTVWGDYTKNFPGGNSTDSYAVVRDQPMTSIGELGNIYDPYRHGGANGFIDLARGGGRTLRVGQPDDVVVNGLGEAADFKKAADSGSGNPRFKTAWMNSAWRLTDVFGVILDPDSTPIAGKPDTATHLVPPQADGKLNINSVTRDGGVALRALLRNFKYLSDTAPASVGGAPYGVSDLKSPSTFNDADVTTIIAAITRYITQNGLFIERGELSQLVDSSGNSIFSSSKSLSTSLATILDRGREEFFRRLIEMLTTRSDSYTVYSMGQSLREQPDSSGVYQPVVTGTTMKAVAYRLDPVIAKKTGAAIADGNPKEAPTAYEAVPRYVQP